jgi:hypothetical protein
MQRTSRRRSGQDLQDIKSKPRNSASFGASSSAVARPERGGDTERGALLGRGMRRYQNPKPMQAKVVHYGLHRDAGSEPIISLLRKMYSTYTFWGMNLQSYMG